VFSWWAREVKKTVVRIIYPFLNTNTGQAVALRSFDQQKSHPEIEMALKRILKSVIAC
jgi:hypothetical protein